MNNKIVADTRRSAWLVPIALAPLLALAGCGSAATSSPTSVSTPTLQAAATPSDNQSAAQSAAPVAAAGGETDVCKLVTAPEAATVLGAAVGAAQPKSQANPAGESSVCTYPPATGNANGQYGVRVNMTRFHDAANARTSYDMQHSADAVDIPGLGDAAFSQAGEIIFIKGPVLVGMGSSTSSQGPSAALVAAAHTAEKRA